MPHSSAAAQFVRERFQSTLPPGVPLPFTVNHAESRNFKKAKADQQAVAHVTMFDKKPASLEISVRKGITSYRWLYLSADCSFENGAWVRVLTPIGDAL